LTVGYGYEGALDDPIAARQPAATAFLSLAGYFAKLTAPVVFTEPPPLPLVPVVVVIGMWRHTRFPTAK
jgi:hypothetical protein